MFFASIWAWMAVELEFIYRPFMKALPTVSLGLAICFASNTFTCLKWLTESNTELKNWSTNEGVNNLQIRSGVCPESYLYLGPQSVAVIEYEGDGIGCYVFSLYPEEVEVTGWASTKVRLSDSYIS